MSKDNVKKYKKLLIKTNVFTSVHVYGAVLVPKKYLWLPPYSNYCYPWMSMTGYKYLFLTLMPHNTYQPVYFCHLLQNYWIREERGNKNARNKLIPVGASFRGVVLSSEKHIPRGFSRGQIYTNQRVMLKYTHIVMLLALGFWCLMSLSTICLLYRGGQLYWWRKLEYPEKITDPSQITNQNFITIYCIEYTSPWARFELTTLVVIVTDCTNCKSNYSTITTTPLLFCHIWM